MKKFNESQPCQTEDILLPAQIFRARIINGFSVVTAVMLHITVQTCVWKVGSYDHDKDLCGDGAFVATCIVMKQSSPYDSMNTDQNVLHDRITPSSSSTTEASFLSETGTSILQKMESFDDTIFMTDMCQCMVVQWIMYSDNIVYYQASWSLTNSLRRKEK